MAEMVEKSLKWHAPWQVFKRVAKGAIFIFVGNLTSYYIYFLSHHTIFFLPDKLTKTEPKEKGQKGKKPCFPSFFFLSFLSPFFPL